MTAGLYAISSGGKYAEVAAVAKRALAIAERKFGPYHHAVGLALNNLAEQYRNQGRYTEAKSL